MNSTILKQKETTFFQGECKNYNHDRKNELEKELLFFIKENGLTISQARELFVNALKLLETYGVLLTVSDYEKITGRDVFANSDS